MNLGFGELLLIFIVILLIFGASKLPQLGDALGKGIKNFKRSVTGNDEIDVTPKKDALPQEKAPAPAASEKRQTGEKKSPRPLLWVVAAAEQGAGLHPPFSRDGQVVR